MFYKGILRKTTLFIFVCLLLIIGTSFHDVANTDAQRWAYTYALGTNEKTHLYPGKVKTADWSNSHEALQQRMSEESTYQNFSAKSSAYIPLPAIVIKGSTVPLKSAPVTTPVSDSSADGADLNPIEDNLLTEEEIPFETVDMTTVEVKEEEVVPIEIEVPAVEAVPEVPREVIEEVSVLNKEIESFVYLPKAFPLVQLILETPIVENISAVEDIVDVFVEPEVVKEVVEEAVVVKDTIEIVEVLEMDVSEANMMEEEVVENESEILAEIVTEVIEVEVQDSTDTEVASFESHSLIGEQGASVISSVEELPKVEVDLPVTLPASDTEVHEMIFEDFSASAKEPGQNINSMQLRLSLAGKLSRDHEGKYPWIEIVYETGDLSIVAGSLILDDELSNALNGSFYMFALPIDTTMEEVSEAKVILRYHGTIDALDGLYIDSVWIEVDSTLITKDDLVNRGKSDQFKSLRRPEISSLVSEKTNFTRDELPLFNLRYEPQRNIAARMMREMLGKQLVEVDEVLFKHHGLGLSSVEPEVHVTAEGNITLNIPESERDKLRPGVYEVEVVMEEGGKVYTDTFDFQWGILTINPDKTEYLLGETSNISIGALTPNGNTVCKTNLQLYVTDPGGFVEVVDVKESGLCDGNNVIDVSDFSALYKTNQIGEHQFYLERLDDEGDILGFTTDTFLVVESQPVSIQRVGPTRIYPPAVYPMKLTVESRDGFEGVLVEKVPSSFEVFDTSADIIQMSDRQELRFDISLLAGESVTVDYSFDAPNISPYLFTLGEAHLESGTSLATDSLVITKVASSSVPEVITTSTSSVTLPTEPSKVIYDVVSPTEVVKEQVIPMVAEAIEEISSFDEATTTLDEITLPAKNASTTELELPVDNFDLPIETIVSEESTSSDDVLDAVEVISTPVEVIESSVTDMEDTLVLPVDEEEVQNDEVIDEGPVTEEENTDTEVLGLVSELRPLVALNSETNIVFAEHRKWQIASDAVGNMIMFWDDNAAIPAGWTCRSCGSGTFFDKFAMGSSTYNTTGGATTHTHTALASVSNTASGAIVETRSGSTVSTNDHAHTFTPAISAVSNLPSYRVLRVIEYTDATGEPTDIPLGAIGIFDATVPAGWTQYSAQDGYYIYGGDTSGDTGGSNSHDHAVTGTFGGATGDVGRRGGSPSANAINTGHTHTVTASSTSAAKEPPYVEVIMGQLDSTSTPPVGMIKCGPRMFRLDGLTFLQTPQTHLVIAL